MSAPIQEIEILLIEDNQDDADIIIRTLKKYNVGNNLVHLTDGVDALDFLFAKGRFSERQIENKPKIVLLDLKMPKLDGLAVLKAIKENEITKSIPVIIMTASSEAKDIIESYQLGVNSYVVKPVSFLDFTKAVADLGFYWLLLNRLPK